MKFSKNPKDYCFILFKDWDSEGWVAAVNPVGFYQAEKRLCDQHYPLHLEGWSDIMEATYEYDNPEEEPEVLYYNLLAQGLTYDEDLATFFKSLGNVIWEPTAVGPPAPSLQTASIQVMFGEKLFGTINYVPGGKIDTALCKELIVKSILAFPGGIYTQFGPAHGVSPSELDKMASSAKTWKRITKDKTRTGNQRGFDCTPFDDQLRAYVDDDGKQVFCINISGE